MTPDRNPADDECRSLTVTAVHSVGGFDLAAVSELSGLHQEFILEIVRARLVRADEPAEPIFDEHGLCRLRQIADLHHRQGLNLRTVKLIVRLLDQLERTEQELRALRDQATVAPD
ncbi:MAG: hypothetical protein ACI8UO_002136 [Verrucomicrobiales bacterium]|jgi:hypothetical protein